MADVGVNIKVDLSGFSNKLSPYRFRKGADAMLNQMLTDMDRYIPKKSGALRFIGHVNTGRSQLVWQAPYARAQYYGKIMKKGATYSIKNYTTPGTGPRWDLKAKAKYGKKWAEVFVKGAGFGK